MPNGRARQHNTAYANRRRTIEREQVVQASMVNPIVIQQAQQVIVEAQIDNSEDLQRQIEELKAKIITKENNLKRIKKEMNKQKKKFDEMRICDENFINELKELDILEECESKNKDGLTRKKMDFVPTKMMMVEKDQEVVATTKSRVIVQKYITFLEAVIVASSNGKNIVDIVGGFEGFDKEVKNKKLLQALIMKNADKDCGEGTSEMIEKVVDTDAKNNYKNLRKFMTGKENGKLVYDK
tara:strand:- start:1542 stop:2261 length:720 start_codon:yes stop_codon:yes gene_type:complete